MSNSTSIQSVARLPKNAFGNWRDVPGNQDRTFTKKFTFSRAGIKGAAKHLKHEWREYRESRGDCAVYGGHLVIDGQRVNPNTALAIVELMMGDSLDDWRAACKQYDQIEADYQAKCAADDAAFDAETRRLEGLDREESR